MGRARAPQVKASWKPGTLYVITGVEGWFYYGQVSEQKGAIGFLRYRTLDIESRPETVLQYPLMSRVGIAWPSLGRALRACE